MFYLINNLNQIVDKSVSKFEVCENLIWVEHNDDVHIKTGLVWENNQIVFSKNDDIDHEIEMLILKNDLKSDLLKNCIHEYFMGNKDVFSFYQEKYNQIQSCQLIENLPSIDIKK